MFFNNYYKLRLNHCGLFFVMWFDRTQTRANRLMSYSFLETTKSEV